MAHEIKNKLKQIVRTPMFKKRIQDTKVQKLKANRPKYSNDDAMEEYEDDMTFFDTDVNFANFIDDEDLDELYQEDFEVEEDPLHIVNLKELKGFLAEMD